MRRNWYRGVERDKIRCAGGGRGKQKVRLAFWPTRVRNGTAIAIRGRAKFEYRCSGRTYFQRAKLVGTRKR